MSGMGHPSRQSDRGVDRQRVRLEQGDVVVAWNRLRGAVRRARANLAARLRLLADWWSLRHGPIDAEYGMSSAANNNFITLIPLAGATCY